MEDLRAKGLQLKIWPVIILWGASWGGNQNSDSHPFTLEYFGSPMKRRDPERGLQSWFRPEKPETRNPKPTVKVGFELRNPKPETDSEDLTSPGPIETRNPKPTLKTYLPQDRSKPETRNRLWRLNFPRADRNPKPETDSESGFQSTKPETRNPKPTAKVGFNRRNPKPETRNRLESDFWVALRIGTPNECWNFKPQCMSFRRSPKKLYHLLEADFPTLQNYDIAHLKTSITIWVVSSSSWEVEVLGPLPKIISHQKYLITIY